MLLHGLHTMLSCTVKVVHLDSSHKHNSNSRSSSSQLSVLMGHQQVLHLQHSHSLVSTMILHVLALLVLKGGDYIVRLL